MSIRGIRSGVAWRVLALELALACGSALAPIVARGQEVQPAPGTIPVETHSIDEIVEWLVAQGKVDEAAAMLDAIEANAPGSLQVRFLRGLVAMKRGDYRRAIGIFRGILVAHPEALRVRLELARSYFLVKDYQNSDRQFRAVRAEELPSAVKANVDGFLVQIRQSKDWSYGLSVAIAPDTNVNGASTSREVEIYGLPFKLSDEARQKSGTGAAIDASAEWAPRFSAAGRMRLGAALQRREYGGPQFDDMTLAFHAGPRFVLPRWDLSVLGTGFRRWYGGETYASSLGGRMEATHYAGPRTVLNGTAGALRITDERDAARDRWVYTVSAGAMRQMS